MTSTFEFDVDRVKANQMSNAWYTLSVFTGREHGCHFGHPWTRAIEIGRRCC